MCSDHIVHQFVAVLVNDPELCGMIATFPIATDNVLQHGGIAVGGVSNQFTIAVIDTGDEQRCSCEVHFSFLWFSFPYFLYRHSSKDSLACNTEQMFFLRFFLCANIVPNAIRPVWVRHGTAFAISSDVSPFISTTYDSGAGGPAT